MVGSGEYDNEPSDSITFCEFLEWPSKYCLLQKDFYFCPMELLEVVSSFN
jgi:hypothetical protein